MRLTNLRTPSIIDRKSTGVEVFFGRNYTDVYPGFPGKVFLNNSFLLICEYDHKKAGSSHGL